eukprot:TRINITY_DN3562_c1_g4_i1.p2 TRINITY_DN3562_c1_g4~~TRINITY_DN3562_c1_g4_i1.p2  ORF type:complete len:146 (+),score=39.50 TRINITY_DN3562_c1_g4_i1:654-1091(+)
MMAAQQGHKAVVELLLEKGASVDVGDGGGWTALMYACDNNHTDISLIFCTHGANLDLQNKNGSLSACFCPPPTRVLGQTSKTFLEELVLKKHKSGREDSGICVLISLLCTLECSALPASPPIFLLLCVPSIFNPKPLLFSTTPPI